MKQNLHPNLISLPKNSKVLIIRHSSIDLRFQPPAQISRLWDDHSRIITWLLACQIWLCVWDCFRFSSRILMSSSHFMILSNLNKLPVPNEAKNTPAAWCSHHHISQWVQPLFFSSVQHFPSSDYKTDNQNASNISKCCFANTKHVFRCIGLNTRVFLATNIKNLLRCSSWRWPQRWLLDYCWLLGQPSGSRLGTLWASDLDLSNWSQFECSLTSLRWTRRWPCELSGQL